MSKSKRNHKGEFVRSHSKAFIVAAWMASIASFSLVWLASRTVMSDFGSFRSCGTDTGILTLPSCGKHAVGVGDLAILSFFALSVCLSFSLTTIAWRATTKGTIIT